MSGVQEVGALCSIERQLADLKTRAAVPTPESKRRNDLRRKHFARDPAAYERSLVKNRIATKSYHKRNKVRRASVLALLKDYVNTYKATAGCVDCGENNPVCLDFDHRDPKEKRWSIAMVGRQISSLKQLKSEIAKCEVRCANCHRIKTYLDVQLYGTSYYRRGV